MSGHNKWSKIKHKKAATDAQKSKLFSKHAVLITMEMKKAGGDASSANVVAAVERAKKDSMPKDNIERALQKGSGAGSEAYQEVIFETFGPGGVGIIISAVTDNNNRTAPEIRHLLHKAGYQLGVPGSAAWAFTKTSTGYRPITPITLPEADEDKLTQLIEALEAQDDVQEIFTTADTLEEV